MSDQHHNENDQLNAASTEQTPLEAAIPDTSAASVFASDPARQQRVDLYLEGLKKEENLMMGLLAGLAAALIGAVLWGVITVSTGYQIGFMAVGIGFMVGLAVRMAGKGMSQIFGISGALLALLGCVLGNLFSIVGFVANEGQVSVTEVLGYVDVATAFSLLKETAQPMDFLFYAIAVYEGYRFSFRNVTDEELAAAGNAE